MVKNVCPGAVSNYHLLKDKELEEANKVLGIKPVEIKPEGKKKSQS